LRLEGKGVLKKELGDEEMVNLWKGTMNPSTLHVVITGDEQVNVDKAGQMINDMLVVIDDEKNVHKQQQLRELALLNGTLKDDEYCTICAEKGHRSFECPKRFSITKKVQVRCAICGDTSHPTRDCARKETTVDETKVDQDYLSFMAELDGKKVCQPVPTVTTPATATAVQPAQTTTIEQQAYAQQQQQYAAYYQQQQLYAQQQAQYQQQYAQAYQQQQPQGENATEGWDYSSYYGNANVNAGAGGFQWWDQDQSG